ncbi:Y-family DNA polymerase, partial [Burkholderia ubonensis]
MRVLLGIHLPRLPLDVCAPPPADGDAGRAVLEQGVVLIADAAARKQGVRAGMKRGGVLTLAPDTQLVERDPAREADA